jgi:hypothetical protein
MRIVTTAGVTCSTTGAYEPAAGTAGVVATVGADAAEAVSPTFEDAVHPTIDPVSSSAAAAAVPPLDHTPPPARRRGVES